MVRGYTSAMRLPTGFKPEYYVNRAFQHLANEMNYVKFKDLVEELANVKLLGNNIIEHPMFGISWVGCLPAGVGTILLYDYYYQHNIKKAVYLTSCGPNAIEKFIPIANEYGFPFILNHNDTPIHFPNEDSYEYYANDIEMRSFLEWKTWMSIDRYEDSGDADLWNDDEEDEDD